MEDYAKQMAQENLVAARTQATNTLVDAAMAFGEEDERIKKGTLPVYSQISTYLNDAGVRAAARIFYLTMLRLEGKGIEIEQGQE